MGIKNCSPCPTLGATYRLPCALSEREKERQRKTEDIAKLHKKLHLLMLKFRKAPSGSLEYSFLLKKIAPVRREIGDLLGVRL